MNTNMTGFQKMLRPCALGKDRLHIGRVDFLLDEAE